VCVSLRSKVGVPYLENKLMRRGGTAIGAVRFCLAGPKIVISLYRYSDLYVHSNSEITGICTLVILEIHISTSYVRKSVFDTCQKWNKVIGLSSTYLIHKSNASLIYSSDTTHSYIVR